MIVIIDNYDSFTYNIVQTIGGLGAEVKVFRNDMVDISSIEALKPDRLVDLTWALHSIQGRNFH